MPEVSNVTANTAPASVSEAVGSSTLRLRPAVMEVKATLAGDCALGVEVNMSPLELEEMQNALRARLDDGLKLLALSKGKDGLPMAPAGSVVAVASPEPPDPNAGALLQALPGQLQQEQEQLLNAAVGPPPSEVS